MKNVKKPSRSITSRRDLYYTKDHEWIDFQGSVAYIGICPFKLKGIKKIESVEYSIDNNSKKSGDVIASIFYDDYKIDVHMPVNGKIISMNDALQSGNENVILQEPENAGFIALIVPASPYDRNGLMISEKYRMSSHLTK